jgi:hypothetical protein
MKNFSLIRFLSTSFSLLFVFRVFSCSHSELLLTPLRTSTLIWVLRFPFQQSSYAMKRRCHNTGSKSSTISGILDSKELLTSVLRVWGSSREKWQRHRRNGNISWASERNFHWFQTLFTWRKGKQMKNNEWTSFSALGTRQHGASEETRKLKVAKSCAHFSLIRDRALSRF